MSLIQSFDLTGTDTANFILEGDGTGGSVAERLGISWNDTSRKRQILEEQAEAREAMAFRTSKVEQKRTRAQERAYHINTGRAPSAPTQISTVNRANTAQFLAMSGRIAA